MLKQKSLATFSEAYRTLYYALRNMPTLQKREKADYYRNILIHVLC